MEPIPNNPSSDLNTTNTSITVLNVPQNEKSIFERAIIEAFKQNTSNVSKSTNFYFVIRKYTKDLL